jgi:hypothetical protein
VKAPETPAKDDTQSSAPVLNFHLLSGRASVRNPTIVALFAVLAVAVARRRAATTD